MPPQGQILGAAKITGLLASRLSIGLLDAITAREDTTINRGMGPDEKLLVDPLTNFGVLRLRQDFGKNSNIGMMGTAVNRIEPKDAAAPQMGDLCPRPHGGLTGVQTAVDGRCTSDAYTGGVDTVLRTDDGAWGASAQGVGSIIEHGPPRRVPDGTTINPGESPHAGHKHPEEELLILKEGTVEAVQNGTTNRVEAGGMIFEASNEYHSVRNIGSTPATYFVFKWYPRDLAKATAK